jgi:hypothetical protein
MLSNTINNIIIIWLSFTLKFKSNDITEEDLISFARSGGSGTIILIALISIAQSPGSDNVRFSSRIFILIFSLILIIPMIAYKYIISNNIGRKPVQPSKTEEALVETELSSNVNPLRTDSNFKTIYKNDEKDYDVPKSNTSLNP